MRFQMVKQCTILNTTEEIIFQNPHALLEALLFWTFVLRTYVNDGPILNSLAIQ